MPDFTGQSIGRYHIIQPLGEGGMAVVYKAYDNTLECDVAVKFILAQKLEGDNPEKILKRFKTEAQKTAALNHPNIIPVTDYGEYEGIPYLVMKYMPGGTLKQALTERMINKTGPFPYQEAAAIIAPIAKALELAHYQGIIHRDIKPSNILLTQTGQPMLTDFGVAKITESTVTLDHTGLGTGIGTPEYMAPEQWEGIKEIDGRVDIYGLGVVFYELVTGRSPFTAETVPAIMMKVMVDPLPRPKKYCKDIPDSVEKVIFKALARKPENRYANMGEFAGALEKLTGGKKAGSFLIGWKKTTSEKQDASTHEQTMDTGSLSPLDGHGPKGEFDPGAQNPDLQTPPNRRRNPIKWYWMVIAGIGILAIAIPSLQIFNVFSSLSTKNGTATPNSTASFISQTSEFTSSPKNKPTDIPLNTLTPKATPTQFILPAAGVLQDAEVTYQTDFNDMHNLLGGWGQWGSVDLVDGTMEISGDSGISRHKPLSKGNGMLVLFKCTGEFDSNIVFFNKITNGDKYIGLMPGSNPNIIISLGYDNAWHGGQELKGNLIFEPDHWYYALVEIKEGGEFYMKVMDKDNPNLYIEKSMPMGGDWEKDNWYGSITTNQFNQGTIAVDSYIEYKIIP
jgi:serine/threonine protein kinase